MLKENMSFIEVYTLEWPVTNSRIIEIDEVCFLESMKHILINM